MKLHIVQPGETLAAIAVRYGVSEAELLAANGLHAPPDVGTKLVIPTPPAGAEEGRRKRPPLRVRPAAVHRPGLFAEVEAGEAASAPPTASAGEAGGIGVEAPGAPAEADAGVAAQASGAQSSPAAPGAQASAEAADEGAEAEGGAQASSAEEPAAGSEAEAGASGALAGAEAKRAAEAGASGADAGTAALSAADDSAPGRPVPGKPRVVIGRKPARPAAAGPVDLTLAAGDPFLGFFRPTSVHPAADDPAFGLPPVPPGDPVPVFARPPYGPPLAAGPAPWAFSPAPPALPILPASFPWGYPLGPCGPFPLPAFVPVGAPANVFPASGPFFSSGGPAPATSKPMAPPASPAPPAGRSAAPERAPVLERPPSPEPRPTSAEAPAEAWAVDGWLDDGEMGDREE
ncbi:MAG: LysM peptidoglycan-binding domain-containing protein [Hydrogenibacillus schlegelii]|nr:LysM peptidoglycan-binding domain-containing protein [Hydrogenibacillus schlegelii]